MILTTLFSCDTAEDYHNQGLSNCELGNYKEAINNFNKAIDINPDFANAYYLRGHVATMLKDQSRTIDVFNKAIEIDPGYARAYGNRGIAKNV